MRRPALQSFRAGSTTPSSAAGLRKLSRVLGPDLTSAEHTLIALAINSLTSLVAGAILGSITQTFERFPGLLVMMPAAIGLRGNVFSAAGSRISTAIQTGEYRNSLQPRTVVGDNAAATVALSTLMAIVLAILAAVVAAIFGVPGVVSLADLITISFFGGALASAAVLTATLILVSVAVRRSWDLDTLVTPVVSTLGDVITVPTLWGASFLVSRSFVGRSIPLTIVAVAVAAAAAGWISPIERLRRIIRESLPVLTVAALLSTLAGLVLEHRLGTFSDYPALLILVPAFVSSAGALGGILSNSLSTRLHLGIVEPSLWPSSSVRADIRSLALLAAPVYVVNGIGAHVVALALGQKSPGLGAMTAVSLLGALAAVGLAVSVSYYGTITATRLNADPDTFGVPIVTSAVDFLGAAAFIGSVTAVGFLLGFGPGSGG